MTKNNLKMELLKHLLDDPTRSVNKLAKKLGTYRKRVLRRKKELEADHIIWGYTAVVDESKLNYVLYLAQFRIQPISKAFAELITKRRTTGTPSKEGVRIIDIFYMNGNYDVIIKFSAPDHATARKYYEKLRVTYKDFFRGDPSLSNVIFPIANSGKLNPETEKLYDFVPEAEEIMETEKIVV